MVSRKLEERGFSVHCIYADVAAAVGESGRQYVSESSAIICALRAPLPSPSGTGRRSRDFRLLPHRMHRFP